MLTILQQSRIQQFNYLITTHFQVFFIFLQNIDLNDSKSGLTGCYKRGQEGLLINRLI